MSLSYVDAYPYFVVRGSAWVFSARSTRVDSHVAQDSYDDSKHGGFRLLRRAS